MEHEEKAALLCCLLIAALICTLIPFPACAREDVVTAPFDAQTSMITVEAEDVYRDFAILFRPALVDVSRPVTVRNGDTVCTVQADPS